MWLALEKKLANWDAHLAQRMNRKESAKFHRADRKWIEATLPQIEQEERAVSLRLQKLEELIAKTKMLVEDVNEDLCRELTGGDDVAAVRAALVEQFGHRLEQGYERGQRTLRGALAACYKLDGKEVRELFVLLKDVGVVRYAMERDPAKAIPTSYYPDESDIAMYAMKYGRFDAESRNIGDPPLKVFWDIG